MLHSKWKKPKKCICSCTQHHFFQSSSSTERKKVYENWLFFLLALFLCVVLFFSLDCHHFRKPTKWSFYGECAFPSLFFPFRYCASSIVLHFHLQFCTQNIEKTYNCIILEMESLSRLKSQRVSVSLCMSTFSYFFSVANAFVFNYYTFFKYSP